LVEQGHGVVDGEDVGGGEDAGALGGDGCGSCRGDGVEVRLDDSPGVAGRPVLLVVSAVRYVPEGSIDILWQACAGPGTATVTDYELISQIHAGLADRELLSAAHLVDAGYVTAQHLVAARRDHIVELVGRVKVDTGWQKKTAEGGFTQQDFTADWKSKHVTCPNGRISTRRRNDRSQAGLPVVRAQFSAADCRPARCARSAPGHRTALAVDSRCVRRPSTKRSRLRVPSSRHQYARRQGVEGAISYGVRVFELRRSRYHGLAKTHLQHLLTAAPP
jgi:hypothetical protein